MLSDSILSVNMKSVIILSVNMMSVIMLSVILLCHYFDWHYDECHFEACHIVESRNAEWQYIECHYAGCHYTECRGAAYLTVFRRSGEKEVFSSGDEWNPEGVFVESFADAVAVVDERPAVNHQLALVPFKAAAALGQML